MSRRYRTRSASKAMSYDETRFPSCRKPLQRTVKLENVFMSPDTSGSTSDTSFGDFSRNNAHDILEESAPANLLRGALSSDASGEENFKVPQSIKRITRSAIKKARRSSRKSAVNLFKSTTNKLLRKSALETNGNPDDSLKLIETSRFETEERPLQQIPDLISSINSTYNPNIDESALKDRKSIEGKENVSPQSRSKRSSKETTASVFVETTTHRNKESPTWNGDKMSPNSKRSTFSFGDSQGLLVDPVMAKKRSKSKRLSKKISATLNATKPLEKSIDSKADRMSTDSVRSTTSSNDSNIITNLSKTFRLGDDSYLLASNASHKLSKSGITLNSNDKYEELSPVKHLENGESSVTGAKRNTFSKRSWNKTKSVSNDTESEEISPVKPVSVTQNFGEPSEQFGSEDDEISIAKPEKYKFNLETESLKDKYQDISAGMPLGNVTMDLKDSFGTNSEDIPSVRANFKEPRLQKHNMDSGAESLKDKYEVISPVKHLGNLTMDLKEPSITGAKRKTISKRRWDKTNSEQNNTDSEDLSPVRANFEEPRLQKHNMDSEAESLKDKYEDISPVKQLGYLTTGAKRKTFSKGSWNKTKSVHNNTDSEDISPLGNGTMDLKESPITGTKRKTFSKGLWNKTKRVHNHTDSEELSPIKRNSGEPSEQFVSEDDEISIAKAGLRQQNLKESADEFTTTFTFDSKESSKKLSRSRKMSDKQTEQIGEVVAVKPTKPIAACPQSKEFYDLINNLLHEDELKACKNGTFVMSENDDEEECNVRETFDVNQAKHLSHFMKDRKNSKGKCPDGKTMRFLSTRETEELHFNLTPNKQRKTWNKLSSCPLEQASRRSQLSQWLSPAKNMEIIKKHTRTVNFAKQLTQHISRESDVIVIDETLNFSTAQSDSTEKNMRNISSVSDVIFIGSESPERSLNRSSTFTKESSILRRSFSSDDVSQADINFTSNSLAGGQNGGKSMRRSSSFVVRRSSNSGLWEESDARIMKSVQFLDSKVAPQACSTMAATPVKTKHTLSKSNNTTASFRGTPHPKKNTSSAPLTATPKHHGVDKKIARTKLPNFAKIHQKNFDKMEDISQMTKRKAARAEFLLSGNKPKVASEINKPKNAKKQLQYVSKLVVPKAIRKFSPAALRKTLSPKPANKPGSKAIVNSKPVGRAVVVSKPTDSKPGYSKFGFKLGPDPKVPREVLPSKTTREDQKKAVGNKSKVEKNLREQLQKDLKGVRMNKRFELLMKMRKGAGN